MENKIKKSLRYSLLDGVFANIMAGLSDSFMAPYAIAMKASTAIIGILASLPNLIGALFQIKSASLVEFLGSRKALINSVVLIHALLLIPVIFVPYLFKYDQPLYLVIFYTLFVSIGTVAFPAWSSLMADHVPETERGKIFGWRNRLFGIINVSSMFVGGSILYLAKILMIKNSSMPMGWHSPFPGFTIIFSIAFISRLISWKFLTKMYEPKLVINGEHRFTFTQFLKRLLKSNFGRFVIFVSAMNFSVYLAAPFFPVYMLRDLKFNYLTFTIITMSATLTTFVMMNIWGRHADSVGNLRVLKLTSIYIPFVPIFWLISHNIYYLILVQLFSGFFWAGFNLSVTNFIYDAVTPQKRTRCIGYFNVINGIAMFSGAAIGGYLSTRLPPLFGYRILALLLLSAALRMAAVTLSSFVREVRKVKDISNLELFYSIIGL